MIVYVPVGNGPARRAYIEAGAGMIVQANEFRFPKLDCPWVVDNGAFDAWLNHYSWNAAKFQHAVGRIITENPCRRPEWCLVPDLVANPKSLGYSVGWRKDLPNELRWYLAIQDRMQPANVENALATARFDGLFIGGSANWKNENASRWVLFGHAQGLPVHIGRVNGKRRMQWAVNIGADSIDGTGWTRNPGWVKHLVDPPTPRAEEPLFS